MSLLFTFGLGGHLEGSATGISPAAMRTELILSFLRKESASVYLSSY